MASITDVSLNWGLYYNLNNNGNDGIVTITTTDLDGSNVFITLDGNNSESVTISDNSANITISDASFSDLTSGTSYTINATIEGTDISNSESFTYETTRPSMTITATGVNSGDTTNDATLSLTFTSSKATTDFIKDDITTTNGSLSAFIPSGDGLVYTATFTPSGDGECTIIVNENTFNDAAGNGNTVSAQFTWTSDRTPATLNENTLIGTTNNQTPSYTFTSDKAGTITSSLTFGGNTNAVNGENTITFSSLGDGSYTDETIIVTDAVGNVATLNISQFTIDTIRPSMTITATGVNSGDTTNDATLSLTFTSSKATTDFAVGDITVTNGSLSAFTKSSDTVYTATFTPIANGNCTIIVNENTFNDAAGNVNTASAQFTWVLDNTAPDYDVTDPIGNFIFNISIPIENRLIGNKSPTLVINTNEAGTLTTNIATGFNSGNSLSVSVGDNTIQLAELQYGTYSGKTLTLTDSANNSKTVTIPTFEVSAATLVVTSGIGIKRR